MSIFAKTKGFFIDFFFFFFFLQLIPSTSLKVRVNRDSLRIFHYRLLGSRARIKIQRTSHDRNVADQLTQSTLSAAVQMRYRVRFKWFVFLITRPACITTATYYLNLKSLLTLSGFRQPVFHRPIKNECQSIIARHNARFFYAAVTCNPSASKMHSKKKKISN